MIALLDPRVWIAVLLAFGLGYGSGRWQQWRSDENQVKAKLLQASEKARQTEQNLRDDLEVLDDVRQTELRRIAAQRDAAVQRLRDRPERLPEAAQAACAGATGAELSSPDGQFLAGEAARADELRAALGECQAREQRVYEALK